jgi:hypothetical protein
MLILTTSWSVTRFSSVCTPWLVRQHRGDKIWTFNERGELGAKAHVTDDAPPGAAWVRDGWIGVNHLTSGHAVLTGDALGLFVSVFGRPGRLWHPRRGCAELNPWALD